MKTTEKTAWLLLVPILLGVAVFFLIPFGVTLYDYKLLNLLFAWHGGAVGDLDAALEELYGEWALYLDE